MLINLFYSHYINSRFELKSHLLAMRELSDIHSGIYMNSVLLETLKEFDIEYNIIRYVIFYLNI
jgi:hypothetical protein